MANPSRQIRVGNVKIEVRQIAGRWRFEWVENGKRRMASSASEEIAVRRARIKAQELDGGFPDLRDVPGDKLRAMGRILALDPTVEELGEFAGWLSARKGSGSALGDVVAAYLRAKERGRGLSDRWTQLLAWASKRLLLSFSPTSRMDAITTADLAAWVDGSGLAPRTKKTLRDFAVGLWKWAADHGHLPEGKTAAERLGAVRVIRGTPETMEPEELAKALKACSPRFVPWLVLSAFGLLRSAELYATGDKSPLVWEDLLWERGIIRVRPETAKTGRKRVAPLHPVLVAWLKPLRADGAICSGHTPYREGETARLAKAIGWESWPANVLRHSAISYRAAGVGLGLAAMEAGNSESEARRSYNDAKTGEDSALWFGLTPEKVGRKWLVKRAGKRKILATGREKRQG